SESKAAHELLKSKFPEQSGDSITVIYKAERGVADPAVRPRLDALVAELRTNPHVVSVVTPYDAQGAQQVSPTDPTIAFATLQLDIQGSDFPIEDAKAMMATAADANGANSEGGRVQFELGGFAIQNAEFENGGSSEGAGTLAAIVILLIAFGSVLAMGLPILTAVMGIGIGLAIIEVLANVVDVPNFTSIVAAMIGLGVGIDYALFIVTRYREGLHAGMDPERATVVAISTAGRAVLFAGTTVVISVLGMLLMNLPFLEGVAVGSAAVVLVTMIGSVTLLPAMLGFVGTNIDRWKVPFVGRGGHDHRAGFWFRWSRLIQRRPWIFFGAGLVALLLLAAPIFSLRLGFPGDESAPDSRTSRRAYDLYTAGFGPGFAAPLLMVVELPGGQGVATVGQLETRLRTAEGVAAATPARLNAAGDTAVITVFPTTSGTSEKTVELVNRLRNEVIPTVVAGTPVTVSVGGPNASFIDQSQAITDRLPIFIAVVVGLSFLLLMAVFRSVLVALKAAVMNLLSIAAAYGVLVAVAQWGWGKDLFGISATGPIANFIPMMMFAILFGLSMDYEVFLLSRIREEYVKTGDNGLAVADGLASTARVITAAAAIMIMVFLSFVLGPELVIKQIGLGLAVAILIDATLVRMVLVPATMELLGKANWWLPRWLDRLLPHVGFDGAEEADLDRELEELTTARR
ncbi:MAG: putative drug exporter of the superfamily, partial [Actinomycetota bacterium]|nr:putative drug exporter of the superfamily [Actinomycetota bacterium]